MLNNSSKPVRIFFILSFAYFLQFTTMCRRALVFNGIPTEPPGYNLIAELDQFYDDDHSDSCPEI